MLIFVDLSFEENVRLNAEAEQMATKAEEECAAFFTWLEKHVRVRGH